MDDRVIDFHAHVFGEHQANRVVQEVVKRAGIPAYADGSLAGLVRSMDRAGIGLSVVSRITTRASQVRAVNTWLYGLRGPRILPLCTAHPEFPGLEDEVFILKERGFPGFKLHPDYQGFFVDEARMFPFYEAVSAAGMWILFHAGLDRGLPGHPVHATPEGLLRVHREFPRLRIIAAHMGGEDVYDEIETQLLGQDVYLDTSFVLRKMPLQTLRRFLCKHPKERILFGTDTPWADQAADLEFLQGLPFLRREELFRITYSNAAELLRLEKISPACRPPAVPRGACAPL